MLKAIISLFGAYGIVLTGRKKHAHFHYQLGMDNIYVYGLIYELENLTGVAIEGDWDQLCTPAVLVQCLAERYVPTPSGLPVSDDQVPVMV
ncbi:acyl carrier protein [Pleomorphovibrio marinus]|uniref:acyl carrier protein n=1 Tax=Pleomorphovibrio marinus TaxID=2164132 RepID=UPI000E0A9353|nr:acyl carrier protein [Pleomorphovibrio marinus]